MSYVNQATEIRQRGTKGAERENWQRLEWHSGPKSTETRKKLDNSDKNQHENPTIPQKSKLNSSWVDQTWTIAPC